MEGQMGSYAKLGDQYYTQNPECIVTGSSNCIGKNSKRRHGVDI